jgi:Xaa-Pro aminopeptidase
VIRSLVVAGVLVWSASMAWAQPAAGPAPAQGRELEGAVQRILPERERPGIANRILKERLETLLPRLMRETGLDMWVVVNREYVEDPVYLTLVPEPVFAARRTTMLVFFDRGADKGVERLTVSRYGFEGYYQGVWNGGTEEAQWKRLAEVIRERNPRKIGVNVSRRWSFGDGLTAGLREHLVEALGPELSPRLTSADALCVRWLETRTPLELEIYPHVVSLARGVVAEAFSERVITPGVTTTEDVAWYIRQRYTDLGLPVWFMPSVNLQRKGLACTADSAFCAGSGVIQRGDVLHTDVGIHYLRLNTDTQEMGYVLRLGETDVPEGLKRALTAGNRWQDLLTAEFRSGRTGNEVFAALDAAARREGLRHSTYSHPIGFHGHAAGTSIGMWDNQGDVPVTGEWKMAPSTAYAIEGNVRVPVPEWDGQLVQVKLEQSALFDGERVTYLAGRQTTWHVVR